jgi:hypothetical protein
MYRRDLIEYFNRVAIISLPESRQRLASLMAGLQYLGIPTAHPKLQFPKVPRPAEADGSSNSARRS